MDEPLIFYGISGFFYVHGHPEEVCQQKLTGLGARVVEKVMPLLDYPRHPEETCRDTADGSHE